MIRSLSRSVLPLAASLALLGVAAPSPTPVPPSAPSPAPSPSGRPVTMICGSPLFIWGHRLPLPVRSESGSVSLGQSFRAIGRPRTAENGIEFVQIDVPTIEAGYPNDRYWVFKDCALPRA